MFSYAKRNDVGAKFLVKILHISEHVSWKVENREWFGFGAENDVLQFYCCIPKKKTILFFEFTFGCHEMLPSINIIWALA